MTPSTTLSTCFNKKNSKLILQIDFSQMDTETQEKFLAHLTQVVNEENLEKDEELVVYHLDFTLTQQSYKILAKFCVIKKERNIA